MISSELKKVALSGKRLLSRVRDAWRERKLPERSLSRPVSIAIVGSGKAAAYHLETLRHIRNVKVACLVNRGRSNPEKLLREYGIGAHHTSLEAALSTGGFEAAIVAVSCEATAEISHALATRGIRCLIEKPLGMSSAEAKRIAELPSQAMHAVAYNRRFYSSVLRAREIVRSLGTPYSIHMEASEDLWKVMASSGLEGLRSRLITNTTHGLDLFTLFYGQAVETKALFARKQLEGVPISFQTGTRFANGCNGTFLSHWQSPTRWMVSLYGDRYRIDINLSTNQCSLFSGKATTVFGPAVEDRRAKAGIYLQDWTFFEAVAQKALPPEPLCSVEEACDTLVLAEQILAATAEK
jgi:predicted dehydrogenase